MLALAAYSAAIDASQKFNAPQALKSARIMNDLGYPDQAAELLKKIRAAGTQMTPADRVQLDLTDVKIARSLKQNDRATTILTQLATDAPGNPEVMLETGKHYDLLSREESDEEKRKPLLAEAKTHYMLAINSETTAQQANLNYGQMLVREGRALDALPFIEKALNLKKSDALEQYTTRVRRAADREKARIEREQAERANAKPKP